VLLKQSRDPEGTDELKRYLADTNGDDRYVKDAERYIDNPRRARELYIPEFSMTTADGRYISTDDLLGKIVVLDFWATWCAPCRASVPELKDIVKKFANAPVVLISISSDDDEEKWRAFIEKNQMTWPQYRDSDNHVLSAFGIHSFPTYVVVDAEGIMRKVEVGAGGGQVGDIADTVKKNLKLLAEKKTKPR
jgi:peroxiredoxin